MFSILKTLVDFILEYGGVHGAYIVLLLIFSYGSLEVGRKRKRNICVLGRQMKNVRRALTTLKQRAKQLYAQDVIDDINARDDIDTMEIVRINNVFECLIDAAIYNGEVELRSMMVNNSIPDADTAEFTHYVDICYNFLESIIWDYIGRKWDTHTYHFDYNVVHSKFISHRSELKMSFIDLIKTCRRIKEDVKEKTRPYLFRNVKIFKKED